MSSEPWKPGTKTAEWGIKGATLAVFVEGLRRRNANAIANAVFMLVGTYLPDVAERAFDVDFHPWQRLYVEVAMLAHAAGFLGPYDDTWWWDHVTHLLSASLLGGIVHVVARRRDRNPQRDVLAAIVAGGLFWEAMEYAIHRVSNHLGVEPMLVHYGRRDTIEDLLFNIVGGLLVLAFGDRVLDNFIRNE